MEIIIVAVLLLAVYFIIKTVILSKEIDAIKKAFATEIMNSYSNGDASKDNFLKFVSDSREWAFDYIETVQAQLKDFIEVADKEFKYFDEYGIVAEGSPHYKSMQTISIEYKKLKSLLPEESKND
jgi:hypothetical protein